MDVNEGAAAATRSTDGRIVIVGGGVIGLSLAYHLAARGRSDVILLERGQLGEGSTSKATGGIRQQFTSAINARIVHRSMQLFDEFSDTLGEPFTLRQHGYVFLLTRETDLSAFSRAVEMQNRLGIPSQVLTPDEVVALLPSVRAEDLVGATYCPTDGSATPQDAVAGYAAAARRLGVDIRRGVTVTGVERDDDGRATGVLTSAGPVEAGVVVLAPGPQARAVGRLAGVDLPVSPHRRQAFAAVAGEWATGDQPFAVDLTTGAYMHPEGPGRLVVGGNDRNVAEGTDVTVDWSLAESLIESLVYRFPKMADGELVRGWAGLREMTPDDHALVGPVDEQGSLWVLAGFSGHGFMQAPAIGEAVADLMARGQSMIDLSPLRPQRFEEGQAIEESVVF